MRLTSAHDVDKSFNTRPGVLGVIKEAPLVANCCKLTKLARKFEAKITWMVYDGLAPMLGSCDAQHIPDDGVGAIHMKLIKLLTTVDF